MQLRLPPKQILYMERGTCCNPNHSQGNACCCENSQDLKNIYVLYYICRVWGHGFYQGYRVLSGGMGFCLGVWVFVWGYGFLSGVWVFVWRYHFLSGSLFVFVWGYGFSSGGMGFGLGVWVFVWRYRFLSGSLFVFVWGMAYSCFFFLGRGAKKNRQLPHVHRELHTLIYLFVLPSPLPPTPALCTMCSLSARPPYVTYEWSLIRSIKPSAVETCH